MIVASQCVVQEVDEVIKYHTAGFSTPAADMKCIHFGHLLRFIITGARLACLVILVGYISHAAALPFLFYLMSINF